MINISRIASAVRPYVGQHHPDDVCTLKAREVTVLRALGAGGGHHAAAARLGLDRHRGADITQATRTRLGISNSRAIPSFCFETGLLTPNWVATALHDVGEVLTRAHPAAPMRFATTQAAVSTRSWPCTYDDVASTLTDDELHLLALLAYGIDYDDIHDLTGTPWMIAGSRSQSIQAKLDLPARTTTMLPAMAYDLGIVVPAWLHRHVSLAPAV